MNEIDLITLFDEILNHKGDVAKVEGVLAAHPDMRDELSSLLALGDQVNNLKHAAPDQNSRIRAKNKLMAVVKSSSASRRSGNQPILRSPSWLTIRLQKLAVTSVVVTTVLFSSGTGLVRASSSSLPGDNLYPVKRSWEGIQLFLVTDPNAKQALQTSFEEERVSEIEELYSENRAENVAFSGTIQKMERDVWTIEGVRVKVSPELSSSGLFKVGDWVNVIGTTEDGIIQAEQVIFADSSVYPSPSALPMDTETGNPTYEPSEGPEDAQPTDNESNSEREISTPESSGTNSTDSGTESESSTDSEDSLTSPETKNPGETKVESTKVPESAWTNV